MGKHPDVLQIISMNASWRKGEQFMDDRKSYLDDIVGNNEPDVLFLPGDKPDMSSSALSGYRQAQVPYNNENVLLYDSKRLRLKTPDWYGFIPSLVVPGGIDINKLMYPLVDILSPPPTQHAVKQFHCISWHWELTQDKTNAVLYKSAQRYVWLAQYLAWISGVEVLIGGDFNLPVEQIQKLLADHNKLVEKDIDDVKPFFREMGYMDCMTENVNRPGRRLRQLKLHKCQTMSQDTDYFVASKEMQLCKIKMIEDSKLPGRCTTMTMTKPATMEYRPIKTEMCIPSRPPRHNGG